jgi:hypothetical protein
MDETESQFFKPDPEVPLPVTKIPARLDSRRVANGYLGRLPTLQDYAALPGRILWMIPILFIDVRTALNIYP